MGHVSYHCFMARAGFSPSTVWFARFVGRDKAEGQLAAKSPTSPADHQEQINPFDGLKSGLCWYGMLIWSTCDEWTLYDYICSTTSISIPNINIRIFSVVTSFSPAVFRPALSDFFPPALSDFFPPHTSITHKKYPTPIPTSICHIKPTSPN